MKVFNNKKGVTLLEGLIALGLLAMVTAGTLGVMFSISRKASKPDIREEMILAVERANAQIKGGNPCYSSENGLNATVALEEREHDIKCMLPPICDRNTSGLSEFTYTVSRGTPVNVSSLIGEGNMRSDVSTSLEQVKEITFNIRCNGYSL